MNSCWDLAQGMRNCKESIIKIDLTISNINLKNASQAESQDSLPFVCKVITQIETNNTFRPIFDFVQLMKLAVLFIPFHIRETATPSYKFLISVL